MSNIEYYDIQYAAERTIEFTFQFKQREWGRNLFLWIGTIFF